MHVPTVYCNDEQGRDHLNCKYLDPRGRDSCADAWPYREDAMFLLLFLSTLGHGSDKLSIKQNMTKEGSAKIVNFITIGAGDHMIERGYISHYYSEYALLSLSIYITLIAIVLGEYNSVFLCNYSMMGQLICKSEPF